MLANSRCIKGEVSRYCPQNCAIIVWADPGTCDILPTMHCKSVNMADTVFDLMGAWGAYVNLLVPLVTKDRQVGDDK